LLTPSAPVEVSERSRRTSRYRTSSDDDGRAEQDCRGRCSQDYGRGGRFAHLPSARTDNNRGGNSGAVRLAEPRLGFALVRLQFFVQLLSRLNPPKANDFRTERRSKVGLYFRIPPLAQAAIAQSGRQPSGGCRPHLRANCPQFESSIICEVSCIDQQLRNSEEHAGSITDPPRASTGD